MADPMRRVPSRCWEFGVYARLALLSTFESSILWSFEKESEGCVQVVLLDPVMYPSALKAFAKEVCRNDLLNFGRLHFFFPDSRLALDLNTDKALKVKLECGNPCLLLLRQL